MKKIISFIGILAFAILLSGCDYQVSIQPNENNQKDGQTNLEEEKNQEIVVPDQMEQEEKNYTEKEEIKLETQTPNKEENKQKNDNLTSENEINKKYENGEYGYSVEYPGDWKYTETNGKYFAQAVGFNPKNVSGEDYKTLVGLLSVDRQTYLGYIDSNENLKIVEEYGDTRVSGWDASKFVYQNLITAEKFSIYTITTNNKTYIISTTKDVEETFVNSFMILKVMPKEEGNVGMYTGLIKKYPDELIAGDNVYYIELSDGTKKDIKVCNKKASKLNDQIIFTANSETETTIYTKITNGNALCVNGIALNLGGQNTIYSGIIKEHEGGGFGGYAYYIELQDDSEKQLQTCDKRIVGIWTQLMEMAGSNEVVDIHSNSPSDAGVCVSGIVVNNL